MTDATLARDLAALLAGTGIALLELCGPDGTLVLRRAPGRGAARLPPAPAAGTLVRAPASGVFLRAHPVRSDALAETGTAVQAGTVLGLLRIGALLLPIAAPCVGRVVEFTAADGETVGYGTTLFRLEA